MIDEQENNLLDKVNNIIENREDFFKSEILLVFNSTFCNWIELDECDRFILELLAGILEEVELIVELNPVEYDQLMNYLARIYNIIYYYEV